MTQMLDVAMSYNIRSVAVCDRRNKQIQNSFCPIYWGFWMDLFKCVCLVVFVWSCIAFKILFTFTTGATIRNVAFYNAGKA